jgi:hypothetical protein
MKKLAMYATTLIALYLVVDHGTNASMVAKAGSQGGASIIDAFQGR